MLKSIGLIAVGALAATGGWHALGAATAAGNDTYRQLNLFGDVFDRIRADYVEVPDEEKLVEAAVNGMLTSLDPHSSYMNPKRFKDMREQTRGEFGGLGIEVTMSDGVIKVVTPIDDTPAAKAGLLANDLITRLDGERVRGMTLNQAVDKMRGKINTPLTVTIVRKGKKAPFDVKIVRDVIRVKSVKFKRDGDIGYVRITTFSEQTQNGLDKALKTLNSESKGKLAGYIIDLRNNPGGLLDQAISVSDTFLERGEIVSTRGRNASETQRWAARKGDLTNGKPIVVLVNGGSASASEIVAGALRDHKRATILGTRSFGKGSVQSIIPLAGQGAIRLTTARYYTPSGTSIQAKGIVPDVKIEQDLPEDIKKLVKGQKTGEASLPGHLTNEKNKDAKDKEAKKEESGSSAYVPRDRKLDKQYIAAVALLHGKDAKVVIEESKAPIKKTVETAEKKSDEKKKVDSN
ncbi:MAG TPA: S41 family peptidase [Rhizobiales bacterium]|nr:S41 family peptidase [Hyphomicrobiales bacterium]